MKKVAAIYNCWDGVELLFNSVALLLDHVESVIIVYQDISNFGEVWSPLPEIEKTIWDLSIYGFDTGKIQLMKYDPRPEMGGQLNERAKRNLGLDFARQNKCTHFISIDNDELYPDFELGRKLYFESGKKGSVCRLQTYFKKPTFMFDRPEDYWVPFIHELNEDTVHGGIGYPFYVDPTRTVNTKDVFELPIFMHHYSWCRKDIMKKARNSSAEGIIRNSTIMEDYNSSDLGEGFLLRNWNRKIKIVPDRFGLSVIF